MRDKQSSESLVENVKKKQAPVISVTPEEKLMVNEPGPLQQEPDETKHTHHVSHYEVKKMLTHYLNFNFG